MTSCEKAYNNHIQLASRHGANDVSRSLDRSLIEVGALGAMNEAGRKSESWGRGMGWKGIDD